MRIHRAIVMLACVVLCDAAVADGPATQPVTPLVHVHAHNDYVHARPLFDALDRGFCSVEADIHLVEGELRVAHDLKLAQPGKTLQTLYLDPLRQRIESNDGRVYPNGPTVVLLIDVKTPFEVTYPALKAVLGHYADVLTTWHDGHRRDGALLAIVTGERKLDIIAADNPRLCACDGELEDLNSNPPADLVPWISAQWTKNYTWKANGSVPMPEIEREKLRAMVKRAHEQGRQVRWWGSPDNAVFWAEIRADGVDLINTDDLGGARAFLLQQFDTR